VVPSHPVIRRPKPPSKGENTLTPRNTDLVQGGGEAVIRRWQIRRLFKMEQNGTPQHPSRCRYDWKPGWRGLRLHCVSHDHSAGTDTAFRSTWRGYACFKLAMAEPLMSYRTACRIVASARVRTVLIAACGEQLPERDSPWHFALRERVARGDMRGRDSVMIVAHDPVEKAEDKRQG
jgi:hypothetical protein